MIWHKAIGEGLRKKATLKQRLGGGAEGLVEVSWRKEDCQAVTGVLFLPFLLIGDPCMCVRARVC